LTVTGGLPFFGGAGNNYSMHAVASMVELLRAEPGSIGFVGANGGSMSKYSVGVYSTTPRPFEQWSDAEAQTEMDAAPSPVITPTPEGDATVETYTVKHDKRGMLGIVVGRLADGSRFVATTAPEDNGTVAALTDHDPMGASVQVTTEGRHAFVSIGAAGAALEPSQGG
jgi:acetyl-CoA C-acetyltransferase